MHTTELIALTALRDLYLSNLASRDSRSPHTLRAYRQDIDRFLVFFDLTGKPLSSYVLADFNTFLRDLNPMRRDSKLHTNSKLRIAIVLRRFLRFLKQEQYLKDALHDLIIAPKRLPAAIEVPSLTQLRRILGVVSCPLLRLQVRLLYGTGMRISEMGQLRMLDFDFDEYVARVHGKRKKIRWVVFDKDVAREVRVYFQTHKLTSGSWLFFPAKPTLVDLNSFEWTVNRKLQQAVLQAGVALRITPHTLRHAHATHALENGVDTRNVQEQLGHADPSSTAIYTHVSTKRRRESYRKSSVAL